MAQVIRITLTLIIAAVTLTLSASSSEAQLFRRLRDNIRSNNAASGRPPATQTPRYNSPYQVAPRPQGRSGQTLTPYAQLTPQQRQQQVGTPANSPSNSDSDSDSSADGDANTQQAQTDAANPPEASETVNVRVVTYYDPRTGRTFQRRFVLPADPADAEQKSVLNTDATLAAGTKPAPKRRDKTTGELAATTESGNDQNGVPRFSIPPIEPPAASTSIVNRTDRQANRLPESGPPIVAPGQNPPASGDQATVVIGEEFITDTAVVPASTQAIEIPAPQLSNAVDSDDQGVVYSVLEKTDNSGNPIEQKIESGTASVADDVEDFFGSN